MSVVSISELLQLLGAGCAVVMPSARAAAELRAAFDARQRSLGPAVWEPAPVLSWAQWTHGLWSDLILAGHEQRLLLSTAQELAVWREIVVEPIAGATTATLGSPDALAQLARDAWSLAARHDAIGRLRASANTHDSRVFAAWADAFARRCDSRGYLSSALLEAALQQHLESGALAAPPTLTLAGFLEETPAQKALMEAFAQRGTVVHRHKLVYTPDGRTSTRAWTVAATEHEELTLAARWVRGFLEASTQPARVAILLPNLGEDRAAVEAVLREVLAPELNDLAADLSAAPWEFSTGPALASLPIIAAALGMAHWLARPLPVDDVTALLLSPYLGGNADPSQREAIARFDASVLRRNPMLRDEVTLAHVLALGGRASAPVPAILERLRDVQTVLQRAGELQRPRSFAEWGELLRDVTGAANWPGDRAPNATEFEATRSWEGLLDSLATLDFQGRRVPYTAFLAELDRQAATTAFTPPATHAPVQVMGLTEAEGCCFDAIVLLRATDANWAQPVSTHPLLAWPLQRSLGMPGTDPAQAAARASAAARDLLECCGSLLCTLAADDASGPVRPSPLLAELGLQTLDTNAVVPPEEELEPVELETAFDDTPLPPLASMEVHGGASVLKLQAACGFLAFAELRLRANELDTPAFGLDAAESGSLLHAVMQHLWQSIHSQEELAGLTAEERDELLYFCIDKAVSGESLRLLTSWDDAYVELLRERLHRLLLPWLDVELARAPFEVIATERKETVSVGPLNLTVRVDRIDSVNGGALLIDYKTGSVAKPAQWIGERPDEPQLPLYTLLLEPDELRGVAFARLRAGKEMKYAGLQAEDGILPGRQRTTDLAYERHNWRHVLDALAEDFASGRAVVDPKDYPGTCKHCAQRLLCRLNPGLLHPLEDEEDFDA